MLTEQDSKISK